MSKDYYDMISRKKTSDHLSDAFKDQANSMQPRNVGQRREQALMRGLSVGLGYDQEREAKLAELENQAKELSTLNYGIQMSAGKGAKMKADNENFFLSNRNDLATLNSFLQKGDFEAVNIMAPTLIDNYKKTTGQDIGDYAYSSGGKIYLEDKQGNVKGQYIADILQGVIPESEQMNFPELLTYNSKAAVQNKLEEQRLKNDQIRAAIAASNASVRSSDAHAKLYESQANPDLIAAEVEYKKAQAEKLKEEAKNLNKGGGKLTEKLQTSNIDFLEESHADIKSKEKQLGAYNNIGKLMTEEFKTNWNRSGAGVISKAQRFLNPSFTDASRRQAQIEMEKEPLYHEIKKIFAGATSDRDVALFVTTLPDLNNSYEANMNMIEQRTKTLEEDIFKLKTTRDLIQNSDYSTHFTHTSIQDKVEELNKERLTKIEAEKLNSNNKIKLQLKNGSIKVYDKKEDIDAINELLNNKLAEEIK